MPAPAAATARTAASQLRLVPRSCPSVRRLATAATTTTTTAAAEQWPQRTPLGEYYSSIMRHPLPYTYAHRPDEPPSTAHASVLATHKRPKISPSGSFKPTAQGTTPPPLSSPEPTPPPKTAQEKARIIFGSRLLGPAEQADRLAVKQAKSTYIAGVLVPPRPEEPDNCCMSGCVNCVWDRYRDDMEEWSLMKNEAQSRLKAGAGGGSGIGTMDADGRGPGANWKAPVVGNDKIAKDMWDDEVYQGIPVGIKEFMKQEKRLKEKHAREGTLGG